MASQIDLGAVVPIGKGDWNSGITYERANIVRHNSTAWICKVATSLGVEPTENSSDWYLLVRDTSSVTSVNGMKGDVLVDTSTADKLTTARKITLTGPITGTANFDGSTDINISTTIVEASTDTKGVVQLSSDINSTSTTMAATSKAVKAAYDKAVEASNKAGLPLGHIFAWPFSTAPDGCIILNGSTYDRTLYADLFAYIKSKGWTKTETEWQNIAQANNGFCPWYSEGDGSTTFRTPKFAPYQKIALASDDAGKYYEAGLPNINAEWTTGWSSAFLPTVNTCGAVSTTTFTAYSGDIGVGSQVTNPWKVNFDASRSNSIYGNSITVQPESHDWIICAVAFGTATNVGSVDVADVMSAVSQIQANPNLHGTAHVVESWRHSNNICWYRKYSDGWIEQGGITNYGIADEVITFPYIFTTKSYSIVASPIAPAVVSGVISCSFFNNDFNSSIILKRYYTNGSEGGANEQFMWYACGY